MRKITSLFILAVFAELVLAQWFHRSPSTTPNNFNQRARTVELRVNRDRGVESLGVGAR